MNKLTSELHITNYRIMFMNIVNYQYVAKLGSFRVNAAYTSESCL